MKIQEFIKQIEHDDLDPVTSDAQIGFYCQDNERGRFAEPYLAREHEDENMENFLRGTTQSENDLSLNHTSETTTARETGWIIPVPVDLVITPGENGRLKAVTGKSYTHMTRSYSEHQQVETHNHVIEIDIPWVIDVPEEYSLFYTAPTTLSTSQFTIIPGTVDTNGYATTLSVPLIPFEKQMRINAGTPLIKLYPVRKQDFNVTATIDELSSDSI